MLGPPNISDTTKARKLKLTMLLDIVKYLPWAQKMFPLAGVQGAQGTLA